MPIAEPLGGIAQRQLIFFYHSCPASPA
jgi:hypothetical protein